jgi:hypothetical protein
MVRYQAPLLAHQNYDSLTLLIRAIARDPELFPEPEEFNPLRWTDPKYPTYKEPLTQYPTIINSTQFGYGRRLCQGQGVADEDMLIGIGSIAWLFNISKKSPEESEDEEQEADDSGYESIGEATVTSTVVESEKKVDITVNVAQVRDSTPSTEGGALLDPAEVERPTTPGEWPRLSKEDLASEASEKRKSERQRKQALKKKAKAAPKVHPTLDFSTLLIAKPLPFSFNLTVRDEKRAEMITKKYAELEAAGEFRPSDEYWGPNQGRDKPIGWGKV